MRVILIISLVILVSDSLLAQHVRRRKSSFAPSSSVDWVLDKDVIVSGDTVEFIFINNTDRTYSCHQGSEYFLLYRVDGDNEILLEDTIFRGFVAPASFARKDTRVVKKVIKEPGNYLLKYTLYYEIEVPYAKGKMVMVQRFDVVMK